MATTPTPAPSGGSTYEQVGAALASETSQTEPSTESTSPEPEKPAEPEPQSEPEAPPAEPDKAEPEPNPYEQDDETDVPPDTLNTLLHTDRGRQIYQSHKTLREFQKPIEQGGIGHVPSVEQVRDYYGSYRDRVLMDNDLASGNPEQAERMLQFLFDPQRGQGPQLVASQLAPTLAKLNPETYAAAAQPFITNYAGALFQRYQEARDSGDEKLRSALWYAANIANYDMTGEWLKDAPPPVNGNGQPDPLAERKAQLDAQEQEIQQARQQQWQAHEQNWRRETTGKIGVAVRGEIDKALSQLKSSAAPGIYDALSTKFHDKVVAQIPTFDRHAWDLYNVKVQNARRDNSIDLAAEYVKLAAPVMKSMRKQFLEEAGLTVKGQYDARQNELRQTDQRKGISNGAGAGPGSPKGAPLVRDYGESQRDFNLRQFKALSG